ncbi:MAG: hypothetical protein H3C28_05810 [Sphingomonadales bacterium]|nr:hypothetical protein [Sphingomonadales bacterium]
MTQNIGLNDLSATQKIHALDHALFDRATYSTTFPNISGYNGDITRDQAAIGLSGA